MIKEYKNSIYHIKGAFKGGVIGIIVGIISASFVTLFNNIMR